MRSAGGDQPIDAARLRDDELLLCLLGAGGSMAGEDDLAILLGEWRATLPAVADDPGHDLPVDDQPRIAGTVPEAVGTQPRRTTPARAPARRRLRLAAVAAVAASLVGGAMTAAAAHARPGSPLWPVTRLMYGELADSRVAVQTADRAVAQARAAAREGRSDDARRLLDEASALLGQIREPADARRVRASIAAARTLLTPRPGGTSTDLGPALPVPTPAPPATPVAGPIPVPGNRPGPPAANETPAPARTDSPTLTAPADAAPTLPAIPGPVPTALVPPPAPRSSVPARSDADLPAR
jgi:hypothetical protein